MHLVALLNAQAGNSAPNGESTPERLRALLAEGGNTVEVAEVPPEELGARIARALAGSPRPDAIVVGGGDGTVSCAAGALAGTGVALGVLPLGTLNHFAKDLGLPSDLADCARALGAGRVRLVDVAEVNGRVFVNNCSIGAYPEAVRRREALRAANGHGKWRAMVHATWDMFRQVRRLHVQLELTGTTVVARSPFVLVSNNHYSGALFARSLRERLDAGTISSYLTPEHRRFPLLRVALRALLRGMDQVEELDVRSAPEITVNLRESRTSVAIDGELVQLAPPFRFRSRPRALRVLAPPP